MRRAVRYAVVGLLAVLGIGGLVVLAAIAWFAWIVFFGPQWDARDLYRAADEALELPYVEEAEVVVDVIDDAFLNIYLTDDATADDRHELWCQISPRADPGFVMVFGGDSRGPDAPMPGCDEAGGVPRGDA